MNKLDKLKLKQQNLLARAIDNLQKYVDLSEKHEELPLACNIATDLESLTDEYHDRYGVR